MLVLTRKANERIYIGNNITITIARLDGHRVKVGIDAPPEILVRRAELVDQWNAAPTPRDHGNPTTPIETIVT